MIIIIFMYEGSIIIIIIIILATNLVLHWLEVFVKMRWMGTTGHTQIKRLSEDMAAELGAEILGDTFVYSVAASVIIFEYYRSKKKEQDAEDTQNTQIAKLNDSIRKLEREMKDVKKRLDNINHKTDKENKGDSKS